jgi:hypothetical protein
MTMTRGAALLAVLVLGLPPGLSARARRTQVPAPVELSEARLDDAIALADAGKYYQANLVLKAIEDGLITDATALAAASTTK